MGVDRQTGVINYVGLTEWSGRTCEPHLAPSPNLLIRPSTWLFRPPQRDLPGTSGQWLRIYHISRTTAQVVCGAVNDTTMVKGVVPGLKSRPPRQLHDNIYFVNCHQQETRSESMQRTKFNSAVGIQETKLGEEINLQRLSTPTHSHIVYTHSVCKYTYFYCLFGN